MNGDGEPCKYLTGGAKARDPRLPLADERTRRAISEWNKTKGLHEYTFIVFRVSPNTLDN